MWRSIGSKVEVITCGIRRVEPKAEYPSGKTTWNSIMFGWKMREIIPVESKCGKWKNTIPLLIPSKLNVSWTCKLCKNSTFCPKIQFDFKNYIFLFVCIFGSKSLANIIFGQKMCFYYTVLPFRKHFFIELLQFIVDVPKPPGLRLIETDATSAKLELKDAATEASNIVQPLLWCSIFHRAKFGQPQETLLPARNLNSLTIKGLKCGTTYRSEKPLSSFLMNF